MLYRRKRRLKKGILSSILGNGLLFTSVVKQANVAAMGSGGWLSAAVCHPHDKEFA